MNEQPAALAFEIVEVSRSVGNCQKEDMPCFEVVLRYPQTSDGEAAIAGRVDAAVRDQVLDSLLLFQEGTSDSIDSAIDDLFAEFDAYIRSFTPEDVPASSHWAIEIDARLEYRTDETVTVMFDRYAYTGGAHPNSMRIFLNFDRATGNRVELDDVVADREGFGDLIQRKLKAANNIPPDGNLADAGYFDFALPKNFALATDGVVVRYNPYEIAPYALGPTEVTLSYDELDGLLVSDRTGAPQ
ncbi:DUF3298 and DUF4163 domain-containing protein [Rubidibacter lacunae]|uniref:DUF3298 and DUF4163 domain-containing protein n=1 Tax=Rubidibacter lacunae TaxID=582514 RepID=UPI0018DE9A2A|nr:DUF3298 and DUF4163 domain-containing protein [Rubidibacter lacunae]